MSLQADQDLGFSHLRAPLSTQHRFFTSATLKPMNLLVETGLVDDHVVDGLVDVAD